VSGQESEEERIRKEEGRRIKERRRNRKIRK